MKSEFENRFQFLVKKTIKSKVELEEMRRLRFLFEEELKEEVKSLSNEMKMAGSKFTDVWELVSTNESYSELIDILIRHLSYNYHDKNIEGIVRALTIKEAKGRAVSALIKVYEETSKEKDNLRWIIGNAIACTMTTAEIGWIIATVNNMHNGVSRSQLVLALGTVKSEQAEDTLIKLLDDDVVVQQAICSLGIMKSLKAKEKI